MAEIKIAGIMRASSFSPNHIGNDAAIFNIVAEQLRKRGCEVNVYSEEKFLTAPPTERIILNMCRELRSIKMLQQLEDAGDLVINSGYGIENCIRQRMARILIGSNIPYPESFLVDTDEVVKDRLTKSGITGCWVKCGDMHSMHREDVSYARHPQEAQELLQEFFMRGIKHAVINRHIPGDLIKFYGVSGTPFFYWFYPFDNGHSKYGAERINGHAHQISFDIDELRRMCAKAADIIDIQIYGGDCVVAPDGSITIIDFNDWPSFAPCREEAGPVIARMIMNRIKTYLHSEY